MRRNLKITASLTFILHSLARIHEPLTHSTHIDLQACNQISFVLKVHVSIVYGLLASSS